MVVNDHVTVDHANVVDITKDWLAHHVLSIAVEVDIFHEGLFGILVCRLKLLPDGVFLELYVVIVIDTVAEHVADNRYCMANVVRETKGVVHRVLARCVSIQLRSSVFNFHLELSACPLLSSLEVKML